MKIIKKGLDELQKQILLGIESRGFWIAFWGSLILLIVQMIFANNIISVISSWLLFMVLAIYEAVSCLKAGIWNSSLYISRKRNAFISSIIAICMGVFQFILVSQRGGKHIQNNYCFGFCDSSNILSLLFSYHNNSQSSEKTSGQA